jgi:hypothetical protein
VVDQTDLKGAWNFDVKLSPNINVGPSGSDSGARVTLQAALQKLGLELTLTKLPTTVLVVQAAAEKPTPNPPGVAEALPPLPEEFEVADIKPTPPDFRGGRFQVLPSGRVNIEGMSLRNLIERAWDMAPLGGEETPVRRNSSTRPDATSSPRRQPSLPQNPRRRQKEDRPRKWIRIPAIRCCGNC